MSWQFQEGWFYLGCCLTPLAGLWLTLASFPMFGPFMVERVNGGATVPQEGDLPVTSSRLFFLRQIHMEFRYPTRYVFLDVGGRLLEQLDEYLVGLSPEYSPDEIRFTDSDGNLRVRVGPVLTSFHYVADPGVETPRDAILDTVHNAYTPIAETLGLSVLERVGIRTYSVLTFPTVEEAVSKFRETFFDYYSAPLDGLGGKPKQIQVTLRSEGVKEVDGKDLGATLTLSPIHILPEIATDLAISAEEWGGGWVLDLDISAEDISAQAVPGLVDEAITTTRKLLEDVVNRLSGGKADAIGA